MSEETSDYLFYAEFSDGYSFRNLIEYLKSTNTVGNFIFSKNGITYTQNNNNNTLLNFVDIRGHDLTTYLYLAKESYIPVGINLNNLRSITKSVGKKDSLRLYMLPENPHLHISISSPNTKELNRNNISVIRPQKFDIPQFEIDEYSRSDSNPNCTAPAIDFNKMCTAMNAIKCSHVCIYAHDSNVIFKGMFDGDIVGRVDRFGVTKPKVPIANVNEVSSKNIISPKLEDGAPPNIIILPADYEYCIKVETSTIKSLGKLNNLSSSGTIKMYMEDNTPFKMIANIGSYGRLTIYLRDTRIDEQ